MGNLSDALKSVDIGSKKLSDLPVIEDGKTMEELCMELEKSDDWVRTRLKALAAQGKLVIGRKQVISLLGQQIWVPAYKVIDE